MAPPPYSASPSSSSSRNMEPRSPAGQSGNNDLIDFIRQGPPGGNNGQPRIPRNVAPFRTTVDSVQFERMMDENGMPDSTFGSQVSTLSKHSTQTATSHTALLSHDSPGTHLASDNEPVITRTRRRIKDPYAIDSDSDDDLDDPDEGIDKLSALPTTSSTHYTPPAAQPSRPQESMLDFLSTTPPSSSSQAVQKPQAFILSPETIAAAKARAAKASIHSATPSSTANGHHNYSSTSLSSSTATSASNVNTHASGYTARAWTEASPQPQGQNQSPTIRRVLTPMTAGNPRGAGRAATNDLADFLRNSGPPPEMARSASAQAASQKGGSGSSMGRLGARFWRKRSAVEG